MVRDIQPVIRVYEFTKVLISGFFLTVCLLLAGVYVSGRTGLINPIEAYVILSGSMEPRIPVGSVVITQRQDRYRMGDVITFKQPGQKVPTTHRIVLTKSPDVIFGDESFVTQGDANKTPDPMPVTLSTVTGKVLVRIPWIGYVINFAKTPKGFLAFIVIPATIVVYEELRNMKKELASKLKALQAKRAQRQEPQSQATVANGPGAFLLIAIIPVVASVGVAASVASAYFADNEKAQSNFLGAASVFPTPTPTLGIFEQNFIADTLVINEVLPDSSCSQGNTEAQWIEVWNGYPFTVNLKNFKITDGIATIDLVTANNIDVPTQSFALLAHNSAIWNNCYSDNNVITANLGGQLDIDTGYLQLQSSLSAVLDTVQWAGSTGLDPLQDQSIEREPDGFDSVTGTNFEPSDVQVRTVPFPGT